MKYSKIARGSFRKNLDPYFQRNQHWLVNVGEIE